jgi:hypothetical protein
MKSAMHSNEFRAFAVLLVLLLAATEAFLAYNTVYTEGELMQGLYWLLVYANIPILAIALRKPRIGAWLAFGLGALLLPWQAAENRRWALIHEEIIAIIDHVEAAKKSNGAYPATLDGYEYRRPWIRGHVIYKVSDGTYRLDYFMDNRGIGYWYEPNGGFDYYPD